MRDSVSFKRYLERDELRACESTFRLPSMLPQISGRYISTLAMPLDTYTGTKLCLFEYTGVHQAP